MFWAIEPKVTKYNNGLRKISIEAGIHLNTGIPSEGRGQRSTVSIELLGYGRFLSADMPGPSMRTIRIPDLDRL